MFSWSKAPKSGHFAPRRACFEALGPEATEKLKDPARQKRLTVQTSSYDHFLSISMGV